MTTMTIAYLRGRILHHLTKFEEYRAAVDEYEATALARAKRQQTGRRDSRAQDLPDAYLMVRELDKDFTYGGLTAMQKSHQRHVVMYATAVLALTQQDGRNPE